MTLEVTDTLTSIREYRCLHSLGNGSELAMKQEPMAAVLPGAARCERQEEEGRREAVLPGAEGGAGDRKGR